MTTDLPSACITEGEWKSMELVDEARRKARLYVETHGGPRQHMEWARLDREDYVEAVCLRINAYREAIQ